ncbi:hypothetical protein DBR42_06275 [Pelomonas sp. HMWF004]|nr:hypothetical protein DBR42_06275 [Pelomonas sp. HMWF004]
MPAVNPRPPDRLPVLAACPRCGGSFECGAVTGHCDCFDLQLTDTLRAELAAQYSSCLCLRCLRELAGAAARLPGG